jgi:hypothetical protein
LRVTLTADPTRIRILLPTAPKGAAAESVTFPLGRTLAGVRVGLRLDESWQSYYAVLDVWDDLLRRDGAEPIRLVTGDRVGPHAKQTRDDIEEWSRLVDCGVVGLGN